MLAVLLILIRGLARPLLYGLVLHLTWNARGSEKSSDSATGPEARAGSVRSINLPHFEPELMAAPGRSEFLSACVSCHSARYVTMQPIFTQRQWEDTVDKMAKVYGAQIVAEQRKGILEYLVATDGLKKKNSDDEDFDSGGSARALGQTDTAPRLHLAGDPVALGEAVNRGEKLFEQNCAACHGAKGHGDGVISNVLWRKPKDLTVTRFSLKLLGEVFRNGKPGTAMPAWRTFPEEDLSSLAAYIQSLHKKVQQPSVSVEILGQGSKLFEKNCAPCHGTAADGKGTAASNLLPPPSNFQLRQPDFDYILKVLRDGVPGTGMPSWKDQLSETDRNALAGFLRAAFVDPDSSRP